MKTSALANLLLSKRLTAARAITDGEFRRSYWHLDFMWGLNGIEHATREHGYYFVGIQTRNDTAVLKGKISGENHPFVEHFKFVQQFANMIDPLLPAKQCQPLSGSFYFN